MTPARTLRILPFVLLTLTLSTAASEVTFRVVPASVPEPRTIFIAGDHPTLGSWAADGVALKEQDDGGWSTTLAFEEGTRLEYKVTRGAWTREALATDGTIPANAVLQVEKDTTVTIRVEQWKDDVTPPTTGGVTGTVKYHPSMEGDGILPRDVLVRLPKNYDRDEETRYPVLYMHDGQQIFDPATSTHGKDWRVDEWVPELVEEGRMRDIIVVGATCTRERGSEYGEGESGPAYRRFVVEKLKPFIDDNYRTLPGREDTAVMGASMGGIASLLLVYEYPEVFSMAGCLSSAFHMDFEKFKDTTWPQVPVRIYMDNGGVGLEQELQPGNDTMLEVLQEKGFVLGEDLLWFCDLEAEHNEEAWARRVWMPLLYFFGLGDQSWTAGLATVAP